MCFSSMFLIGAFLQMQRLYINIPYALIRRGARDPNYCLSCSM